MRLLLVLIALVVGVAFATDDPALTHLEKLAPDLIGAPGPYYHWLETGLGPLRAAHKKITPALKPAGEKQVRARIAAADVVFVTDWHHRDPCRHAFRRIVLDLADPTALRAGRVAIALEAVPAAWEDDFNLVRKKGESAALHEYLKKCWAWPVRAYVDMLLHEKLAPAPVLAVRAKVHKWPDPATPDAERQPPADFQGMTFEDIKYGVSFGNDNLWAAGRIGQWIRRGGKKKRRVFVLYGSAHPLGAGGIKSYLEAAGLKVVVLAPYMREWEIELRKRFGQKAAGRWYELAPGVFRAPYVTDKDLLAIPLPKKAKEAAPPKR